MRLKVAADEWLADTIKGFPNFHGFLSAVVLPYLNFFLELFEDCKSCKSLSWMISLKVG